MSAAMGAPKETRNSTAIPDSLGAHPTPGSPRRSDPGRRAAKLHRRPYFNHSHSGSNGTYSGGRLRWPGPCTGYCRRREVEGGFEEAQV